ncbi:hypothetical protein AG1IA_09099 [Rhizoctonia solani AG-1 IA]|uniref:Uncharacterized protein n=1 Tax=Thanatephorus cucumeris (strain AG1-IA) TaxID=983506 RepID=L8WJH0_THACA|nr:hypothetical protein AG1IA_09099 [Rhizoctonia solani AG-1 IA]
MKTGTPYFSEEQRSPYVNLIRSRLGTWRRYPGFKSVECMRSVGLQYSRRHFRIRSTSTCFGLMSKTKFASPSRSNETGTLQLGDEAFCLALLEIANHPDGMEESCLLMGIAQNGYGMGFGTRVSAFGCAVPTQHKGYPITPSPAFYIQLGTLELPTSITSDCQSGQVGWVQSSALPCFAIRLSSEVEGWDGMDKERGGVIARTCGGEDIEKPGLVIRTALVVDDLIWESEGEGGWGVGVNLLQYRGRHVYGLAASSKRGSHA